MEGNPGIIQISEVVYRVLLVCVLWAAAMVLGMQLESKVFFALWQNRLRVLGIVALNLLVVPGLVLLLIQILFLSPDDAVGLLLLAAAAGGPYALKVSEMGQGDALLALFLVILFEALNVVLIPFWLGIFAINGAGIPAFDMFFNLGMYILLPLAIGFGLARLLKEARLRWVRRLQRVSSWLLFPMIVAVSIVYWTSIRALLTSPILFWLVVVWGACMVSGYFVGRVSVAWARTSALVTSTRATAIALVAVVNLPHGTPHVIAILITYGVLALIASTGVSMLWRRRDAARTAS